MDGYKLRQEAAKHTRMANLYDQAGDVRTASVHRTAAISMVHAAICLEQLATWKANPHG